MNMEFFLRSDYARWSQRMVFWYNKIICVGIFDVTSELSSLGKNQLDDHLCSWIFFLEWKLRFLLRRDNARWSQRMIFWYNKTIGVGIFANWLTLVFCVHFWEKAEFLLLQLLLMDMLVGSMTVWIARSPVACSRVVCSPVASAPLACLPIACSPIACSPVACSPVACSPVACSPVAFSSVAGFMFPSCLCAWWLLVAQVLASCVFCWEKVLTLLL